MTVLRPLLVVSALFRLQGRGGFVLGGWICQFLSEAFGAGWGGERLDSVRPSGLRAKGLAHHLCASPWAVCRVIR